MAQVKWLLQDHVPYLLNHTNNQQLHILSYIISPSIISGENSMKRSFELMVDFTDGSLFEDPQSVHGLQVANVSSKHKIAMESFLIQTL